MSLLQQYDFDALPYCDVEFDDVQMQARVRVAIEAEMQSLKPKAYLKHLPNPQLNFEQAPMAREAWQKTIQGLPPSDPEACAEALKDTRIATVPSSSSSSSGGPSASTDSLEEWKDALRAARVVVASNDAALETLDLMQASATGPPVWRHHNECTGDMRTAVSRQATILEEKVKDINAHRRSFQHAGAPDLQQIKRRRLAAVSRVNALRDALK